MRSSEESKKLVEEIKGVILKYCPYSEDRIDLCCCGIGPEFDVEIHLGPTKSNIYFLFGNHSAKGMIEERIENIENVSVEEIEELIDFIKNDHEAMIYKRDKHENKAEFKFNINWREEARKGINCQKMGLKLFYGGNMELGRKYAYLLNKKYCNSSDLATKWDYIDSVIKDYIAGASKEEIIELFRSMPEEKLKEILSANSREIVENPKVKEKL